MRKTVQVKIYAEDREVLRQMTGTMAQAVNSLLNSKDEVLESYAENYFNPKIEKVRKALSEQIGLELERRHAELVRKKG